MSRHERLVRIILRVRPDANVRFAGLRLPLRFLTTLVAEYEHLSLRFTCAPAEHASREVDAVHGVAGPWAALLFQVDLSSDSPVRREPVKLLGAWGTLISGRPGGSGFPHSRFGRGEQASVSLYWMDTSRHTRTFRSRRVSVDRSHGVAEGQKDRDPLIHPPVFRVRRYRDRHDLRKRLQQPL